MLLPLPLPHRLFDVNKSHKTFIFTVARLLSTNINDDIAQCRLRLVFAPHTSASRRKVKERLQSAALMKAEEDDRLSFATS